MPGAPEDAGDRAALEDLCWKLMALALMR